MVKIAVVVLYSWADLKRGLGGPAPYHSKSQVAICFLKISSIDTPQEAIGPIESNCFSSESVQPTVRYMYVN